MRDIVCQRFISVSFDRRVGFEPVNDEIKNIISFCLAVSSTGLPITGSYETDNRIIFIRDCGHAPRKLSRLSTAAASYPPVDVLCPAADIAFFG